MSKKHLNYFSAKEQGFAKWFESWRTKIFLPISRLLNFFGITANMVSYFGFLILIGFIYFVPKDPVAAIYFLLAHVLIDAFDGPLSRLRKEDSDGGAFTDIMCDHTGMVIVVATLAYFSLVDPIISIAYVYLYTVMIIFVIV
ncbi:CDP-alcohol phosphatidyltransferase family protein, partial [Patescibacteria group bacterium]|nr:CDP-alcohol phosphatidyltransferase family protein [Patescibacteria group bacterium]